MDTVGILAATLVGIIAGGAVMIAVLFVTQSVAVANRERNLKAILARAVELRRARHSDLDDIDEQEGLEIWDAARVELGFGRRYSSLLLARSLAPGESVPWQPF